MRTKLHLLFITLALLTGVHPATAQSAKFFRVAGPTVTTITNFGANGMLVWSGATPGATYTVQIATSLADGGNWEDYDQIVASSSVNTNLLVAFNPPAGMVLIPGGGFTMGNSIGDYDIHDANPTVVTVSAFYMDINLVSYSQWQSVYNWATNHGYHFDVPGLGQAANNPVQTVDWYDCVKWSNARSQQAGLTPVYYTDAGLTRVYTNGDTDAVYASWTNSGYRLPTEAEWEKAARGGLNGHRFPWGDTISESQANYNGDTNDYSYDLGPSGYNTNFTAEGQPDTSPVGYFAANNYGLKDMAGNVEEWCWDWYGTPYGQPTATNPTGPLSGTYNTRVLRGGAWDGFGWLARCAQREGIFPPGEEEDDIGFRCVRGP